MKWIAVILALANVMAYLIGVKLGPMDSPSSYAHDYATINASAMKVIAPQIELAQADDASSDEAISLEETKPAQIKINPEGQVSKIQAEPEVLRPKEDASPKKLGPVISQHRVAEKAPVIVKPVDKPKIEPTMRAPIIVAKVKVPEEKPVVAPKQILSCYRVGPFSNQNALNKLRRQLESQGVDYQVEANNSKRGIKAVRVYLGAFENKGALTKQKKRLEQLDIDHFVIRLNGTPLLQLGYFSEPALALAYQKRLQAKGFAVKADKIYHNNIPKTWLALAHLSQEKLVTMALPKTVKTTMQTCP